MKRTVLIGVLIALCASNNVDGQYVPVASARQAVANLTSAVDPLDRGSRFTSLRRHLQQADGPVASTRLDSIVAELRSIVMSTKLGDQRSRVDATDAISLIELAGASTARRPYPNAFNALRYLHQNAPDIGIRGAALNAISGLADRKRATEYISAVAVDSTAGIPMADLALKLLASRLGADGAEALRRMNTAGAIKDPELRTRLKSLISKPGM